MKSFPRQLLINLSSCDANCQDPSFQAGSMLLARLSPVCQVYCDKFNYCRTPPSAAVLGVCLRSHLASPSFSQSVIQSVCQCWQHRRRLTPHLAAPPGVW